MTGWPKDEFTAEEEQRFWNGRIGRYSEAEEPRFVSTKDLFRIVRHIDSTVRRVTSEIGIEYLPIRPVLETLPQPCYDHMHLTDEGACAIGLALAAAVLKPVSEGSPLPISRAAGVRI